MADNRFKPEDDAIESPMIDPLDLMSGMGLGALGKGVLPAALKSQILKRLLAKKIAQQEAGPVAELAASKAQVPLEEFRKLLNPDVFALQTEGAISPAILEADKAGNAAMSSISKLDALRRKLGITDIDPSVVEEVTKKIKK